MTADLSKAYARVNPLTGQKESAADILADKLPAVLEQKSTRDTVLFLKELVENRPEAAQTYAEPNGYYTMIYGALWGAGYLEGESRNEAESTDDQETKGRYLVGLAMVFLSQGRCPSPASFREQADNYLNDRPLNQGLIDLVPFRPYACPPRRILCP